jgi:hypothetical protein
MSNVYDWLSANFISLNPSKTEILLVGLPQQLSKLSNRIIHLPNNVTLDILSAVHSTRDSRVIFDGNLTLFQHLSAVCKTCFILFITLDAFEILLMIGLLYSLYYCYFTQFILDLTVAIFSY